MPSILNEADRAEIVRRLRSLSVTSAGRWGSMDVTAMLQHLRLSARMALGEIPVPSANKRVFQVFPKGAPTAPELKPVAAESFEEERAAVLELTERIAVGAPEGGAPAHPLFGP